MKIQIGDEVREMTNEEKLAFDLFLQDVENNKKVAEKTETLRKSALDKLAKLGLSADEIKVLYEI